MAHCKHWHDGVCKDCRKNCHIKASMARKAAKATQKKVEATEINMEFATPSPALIEALAHGKRVSQYAAKIYNALSEPYALAAPWEEVLAASARLHDIGWVYGQKKHHKVSARIIRSGTIEDLDESLRTLAALVARYHRRTEPSPRHRRFATLGSSQRRGVRRVAAILRIAELGFFGEIVRTMVQTPRLNGFFLSAGDFDLVTCCLRPFLTSWFTVGIQSSFLIKGHTQRASG